MPEAITYTNSKYYLIDFDYIYSLTLQELYSYYKWIHSSVSTSTPMTMSPGLLNFLQTLLARQPNLGHSLVTSVCPSAQQSKNAKSLQMVYINAVTSLMDTMTTESLDDSKNKNVCDKIYEILSLFELKVPLSQLPVRQMFSKLIELSQNHTDVLIKTRLVSALIGHKDLQLLEEFCKVDYEFETNKAVETYQAYAELSEEQRWLLHLSSLAEVNIRWKMFLFFTMKMRRHVLEVILV